MFKEAIEFQAQALYHKAVIEPFRNDFFRTSPRIEHLELKRRLAPKKMILAQNKEFKLTVQHGGLSLSEHLELAHLHLVRDIKSRFGEQPLGHYPQFCFTPNSDGTKSKPYTLTPGIVENISKAIPDLITLAAKHQKGVYFHTGIRGGDPLLHMSQNFDIFYGDPHIDYSTHSLDFVRKEALKHIELMRRETKRGFCDTITWYDTHATEYAASIANVVSFEQIESFISRLPPNGEILDAGCGGGRDLEEFAKRNFKTTGIDLTPGLLQIARKRSPNSLIVHGNFLHTNFPNRSFDGIWVHASMHHLETMKEVHQGFSEFHRLLKPGGILHLATQAKTGKNNTAMVVDTLAGQARFYRYLTLEQVRELHKKAGFKILEISKHKETDDNVNTGRKNVEWIVSLAIKI